MEFIRLNRWKIFCIFCLCIIIFSAIGFICYLSERENMNEAALHNTVVHIMLPFVFSFAICFFLEYFLIGLYNFYKARRLLSYVLSHNIFDNNDYSNEYIHKNNFIFYTNECVYGKINGYPTIMYVNNIIAKSPRTTIEFIIFIIKFNKTRPETISFVVKEYLPPENIRQSVIDFISMLRSKGYEKGNISNGLEASDMIKSW